MSKTHANISEIHFWTVSVVCVFAVALSFSTVFYPRAAIGVVFGFLAFALVLVAKRPWTYTIWIAIFGLAIWSYGFNNIPLVRPLPLVDALVFFAVVFSLPYWWPLRKITAVRRLLVLLSALMLIVFFRFLFDIPRFGLLAVRDALFAFELWVLLPAIALGLMLGHQRLNRHLLWIFSLATAWFLLYPWREAITAMSPIFGIQRPVPLFAFTTAGFVSVPAFFWFLWHRRSMGGTLLAAATLLVLLLAQSRGSYIAFFGSLIALFLLQPATVKRWWRLALAGVVLGGILGVVGGSFTGRLDEPIGIDTVVEQLQTLTGKEGPGAGSFHHRLVAWPMVIQQVLNEPLGPLIGVGLGVDLFQGFALGPDIPVRKPHNDFLEIWARLGVIGFLPWLGLLVVLGVEAVRGVRQSSRHVWVLTLQIALWVKCISQPAMGFAYITVVWAGLTGLWLGAQLREQGLLPVKPFLQSFNNRQNAHPSRPHPLPPTRR